MLKKILFGGFVLILIIIIGALIFRHHITHRSLPDYGATIALNGLTKEVDVYRDSVGMPHVYAQSEADLYRTVGYLTAQDRFWQMDLLRRVTMGKVSEIVGEKSIKLDLLMRSLRLTQKSEALLEHTDPKIIAALEAYAAGVNQYLEDYKDNLPQEFTILSYEPEKWETVHSVNLIGYMAWDLTPNYKAEIILKKIKQKLGKENLKYFLPNYTDTALYIFPEHTLDTNTNKALSILDEYEKVMGDLGVSIFSASNNWAVSGKKAASGKPILCNDMHLKLSLPSIWYPMHQVVPGELNVTGVVLPGQPLIVCGHNEDIAWGMTNVTVDNIDFYEEKLNPDDSSQYIYKKQLLPIKYIEETIKLKGGGEQKKVIRYTHHGPIISDFNNTGSAKPISMKWIGSSIKSDEFRSIYLLNRAKNWKDFREALKTFRATSQNINYADKQGNIGLQCAAGIPIRKNNIPYTTSPGWIDSTEWDGYVPFEKLPYEYNPDRGYVSSANNKTVEEYPYYIGNWFASRYRISRIREMLEKNDKITPEYMQHIQTDFHCKLAMHVCLKLKSLLKNNAEKLSTSEKKGLELLSSWNYNMAPESAEALVYSQTIVAFLRVSLEDELGHELYKEMASNNMLATSLFDISWFDPEWPLHNNKLTKEKETLEENILKAYKEAIAYVENTLGDDPKKWQWGKVHQLTIKHPVGNVGIMDFAFNYNRGPYNMGGGKNTVSPFHYMFNDIEKVTHGPSQRHIFTIDDWDNSQTVIPGGISGHSVSPHYSDQLMLYLQGEYHPDYFSTKAVKLHAVSSGKFVPAK